MDLGDQVEVAADPRGRRDVPGGDVEQLVLRRIDGRERVPQRDELSDHRGVRIAVVHQASGHLGHGDEQDAPRDDGELGRGLDRLRDAVDVRPARSGELDVGRGLIELSDIGVRALSPGINDPTTAIVCIDRLTEVMSELHAREFRPVLRLRKDGCIGFFMRRSHYWA